MSVYAFGPYVLDVSERLVTQGERRLAVVGKTFEALCLLVEAQGRLVERETFVAHLWPDVSVEERNLTVQIAMLRKALNGGTGLKSCIETVARAGYRLSVPVRRIDGAPMSGAAASSGLQLLKAEARDNLNKVERLPALRALMLFERALTLDPNDADCHAGMASTYLLMASTMLRRPLPVDEATRLAREAAHRALVLDDANGEARGVLGRLKMTYAWDWAGAGEELTRAVALAPRSPDAAVGHAVFLLAQRRPGEAVDELLRARRLAPLRRDIIEQQGLAHWMAGDGDRALAALADAAAIDPLARRPHMRRMLVLDQLGRPDEAMAARRTWLQMFEQAAFAARLDSLMRTEGYRAAMLEWIAMLERLNQWYEVAMQRMVVDDTGAAVEALEKCVAIHADLLIYAGAYPSFRPLHGNPRFQRILERLGLPPA